MFSKDYFEARREFRRLCSERDITVESHEVMPAGGEFPENLTIDAAVVGSGDRVVLLTSGIHGAEGYAGSAMQLDLLQRNAIPDDLKIVLVHVLNPYGMALGRRVNESNVDLNRNFIPEGEAFTGASDGYRKLDGILNPTTPAKKKDLFLLSAAWRIVRYGFSTLKQATVGGQYEFDKGLFFGGKGYEKSTQILTAQLPTWLSGAKRLVHVDIHTGLGSMGDLVTLVEEKRGSPDFARLQGLYGESIQGWDTDQSEGYEVRGGFHTAVAGLMGPDVVRDSITIEVGTYPDLHLITALRRENQATHWGGAVDFARSELVETFAPADAAWRSRCVDVGREIFEKAFAAARQS